MRKQFAKLRRSPWNNHWSEIHNFTKKEGEIHHTLSKNPQYEKEVNWEKAFEEAELEISEKEQTIVPFIQGCLPLEEENGELHLLVLSKNMSTDNDEKIMNWINKNNLKLLKSEKRKFDGHGKNELIAIKVMASEDIELDFEEIDNPTVFSGKHDVESKQGNYFVDFGDER